MMTESFPGVPAGKRDNVSRTEAAVLLGILLLAAVVRLALPGLTEFKADEGRLLTAALEMSKGEFALRGISSSVGFPNAPMSVWLYSLPLFVWRHPYAATLFTGLLSVAAVAGVYWLGRRYWGVQAATVAALMLAVSPWAIIFSRKIWAQNLLPVFAVGWAIAAALAFVEGRPRAIIPHLIFLAVAVQIHPSALGLVPATLLFLVVFRRRVDWRLFVMGGVLAVLTAAPFLWYLGGRMRAEGGLPFSTGQAAAEVSLDSLRLSLEIATGQGIEAIAAPGYAGLPGAAVIRFVWLVVLLVAVGWGVYRIARRWNDPASQAIFVCLAWFLGPILFFLWHRTPVYIHYFIVSLPALYLMAGGLVGDLIGRVRVRRFVWPAIGLIAILQLAMWIHLMAAIGREPGAGGFGIPLSLKVDAADRARSMLAETGAAEVLVVGDGSDPEREDFPAEFRALLHDVPLRYVDLNAEALFPASASVALLEPVSADGRTSTRDLFAAAAAGSSIIDINETAAYTLYALPPAAAPDTGVPLPQPALLANFVHLIGYEGLRSQSGGALWDVRWRTADNPDSADYHFFNHLLDGSGARIAQVDGSAFAGTQWRSGDVVISRFWLPLSSEPQPPLTMRVGMYRYPSMENVPLLDEAANPAADALEIKLSD